METECLIYISPEINYSQKYISERGPRVQLLFV